MEYSDDLIGKLARLPNDDLVEIESLYDDGTARVIRVEGPRAGTIAVCKVSKLEDAETNSLTV